MKTTPLLLLALVAACGGKTNNNGDGGGPACTAFGAVCLFTPTGPATRTPCGDVTEFCDPTSTPKPNLACLTGTPAPRPPTPATVTLTGFVHVFSSGPDSKNVSIAVYDAVQLKGGALPSTLTPLATQVAMLDAAT